MSPNKYTPTVKNVVGYKTKVRGGSGKLKKIVRTILKHFEILAARNSFTRVAIAAQIQQEESAKCPVYVCVPPRPPTPPIEPCPDVICPADYKVEYIEETLGEDCPE